MDFSSQSTTIEAQSAYFISSKPNSPHQQKENFQAVQKKIFSDRFIPIRKDRQWLDHQFQGSIDLASPANNLRNLYKQQLLGESNTTDTNSSLNFSNHNQFKFSNDIKYIDSQEHLNSIMTDSSTLNYMPLLIRKIMKVPYKVLDAPALQDDFYLNLIDWNNQNILAVGLGQCIYLWSAQNSKVTKLCDLGIHDSVTSVNWPDKNSVLALGTNKGDVQIWDTEKIKKIRTFKGHAQRVGALSWNGNTLASGSRDKTILQRDLRDQQQFTMRMIGHKQEVCGLKWSFDQQQLASGGNDNKLFIWSVHSPNPMIKFSEHTAAVKAIAWSPHQHGLLASGGGTADRTIRFWNSLSGKEFSWIDTGSQVCNLMFAKQTNEIISTHGYSQNQIVLWKYPKMEKIVTLTGHTYRVLYLAMSPDGQTIVTGAGDETLRFWNIYERNENEQEKSIILDSLIR